MAVAQRTPAPKRVTWIYDSSLSRKIQISRQLQAMSWEGKTITAKLERLKRDSGDPIPLFCSAIQVPDAKKLEEAQGVDMIIAGVQNGQIRLVIYPAQHASRNNFPKFPRDQRESMMGEALNHGDGLGLFQRSPCGPKGLANTDFARNSPNSRLRRTHAHRTTEMIGACRRGCVNPERTIRGRERLQHSSGDGFGRTSPTLGSHGSGNRR